MNATEERERSLRARYPRESRELLGATKYRSNGVVVQVVFFLLTCLCVGAAYLLLNALGVPSRGVITGVAAIAVAEFLIRKRNWFGTGVEAALWLTGLFCMISDLPSTGAPEALLLMAAAAAVAGARVRNPLFGAVAAGFVIAYAEKTRDLGVVCALVIAGIAGVALLREWQRPSTEWLWVALVVTAPAIGRFTADAQWRTTTIVLYALFGVAMFVLGITRRHHALLGAGAIGLVIAAADASERIALPVEGKLAVAGAVLLGVSFAVSRALRGATLGIVVSPASLTEFDDALAAAGAVIASHAAGNAHETAADAEARPAGGGGFGGAGASDSY